jgi:hypothetical protein
MKDLKALLIASIILGFMWLVGSGIIELVSEVHHLLQIS